jgi:hypothetical protein
LVLEKRKPGSAGKKLEKTVRNNRSAGAKVASGQKFFEKI